MNEEERLMLNNYIEDLYQAMQIGSITFEPKHSSELYDLISKVLKENQQLKEQLQQKEDIINKITNYCKFQIEKEQDKFPKPLESEKWLKGRISAFEEILDNKGE